MMKKTLTETVHLFPRAMNRVQETDCHYLHGWSRVGVGIWRMPRGSDVPVACNGSSDLKVTESRVAEKRYE